MKCQTVSLLLCGFLGFNVFYSYVPVLYVQCQRRDSSARRRPVRNWDSLARPPSPKVRNWGSLSHLVPSRKVPSPKVHNCNSNGRLSLLRSVTEILSTVFWTQSIQSASEIVSHLAAFPKVPLWLHLAPPGLTAARQPNRESTAAAFSLCHFPRINYFFEHCMCGTSVL